jgi:hypothetical protein
MIGRRENEQADVFCFSDIWSTVDHIWYSLELNWGLRLKNRRITRVYPTSYNALVAVREWLSESHAG